MRGDRRPAAPTGSIVDDRDGNEQDYYKKEDVRDIEIHSASLQILEQNTPVAQERSAPVPTDTAGGASTRPGKPALAVGSVLRLTQNGAPCLAIPLGRSSMLFCSHFEELSQSDQVNPSAALPE